MARLPTPGSDVGQWGDILNAYLLQAHKIDGTLKDKIVTNASLSWGAVTAVNLAPNSVTATSLAPGSVTADALAVDAISADVIQSATITEDKLDSVVQSKLNYIGTPGSTGPQGPQGSTGATGVVGPQGSTGATGPQGPQGDTGATGPQGPQGSTGPQGPIGLTGATGPQGPQGDTGATGPQGPQGSTGPQGDPATNLVQSVNTRTGAVTGLAEASDLTAHTSNTSNPHSVTKAQVGLGNVDNTSDLNKPISTATQTALDGKLDDTQFSGLSKITVGTTAPASPAIGDLWVDTN